MFGVDKIALIRRAHFSDGKKIKEIVQGYRIWGEANWERRVARN